MRERHLRLVHSTKLTDEFVLRLLRAIVRTRRCSGLPVQHGVMKKYRDVIRTLEKREARDV